MHRITLVALLFLSTCATVFAQVPAESDGNKFVRLTKQLENAPLSDTDKSIRSWLLQWASDSPDITVVACDIMDSLSEEKTPNGGIYTIQMIFGNAAYQISNPDKKNDLYATQLAGVRSALKAYQAVLAKDPTARIRHFDELLEKDRNGTLEAYLAPVIDKNCNESGEA